MHQYPFNPFSKELSSVTSDDLAVLRNVAEGWYVDYKRAPLEIRELAKHMSAFANQYGGWLFFGIAEAANGSRMAGEFPGLAQAQLEVLSSRLRDAVGAHISPPTLYEEHIVHGPCSAINLPGDRAILIVGIPQGQDPPYIHSSGRVYRRLADQSKPKEETDRHTLDILWERGRLFRSKISDLLRRTPEFRDEQKNVAWAFVFLTPDLRLPQPSVALSYDEFRRIVRNDDDAQGSISIPLQEVRRCEFGFAARQPEGNNPQFGLLGLRWWHDGRARIDIPINVWDAEEFRASGSHYRYLEEFLIEVDAQRHESPAICDLSWLVLSLAALLNLYVRLRAETTDNRPLYAACEIRNVFYRVPFFNSSLYVQRCRLDGVPVITERTIVFPERPYFDNMLELPESDVNDDMADTFSDASAGVTPYLRALPLLVWMLSSLGVASDPADFSDPALFTNHSKATSNS